MKKVKSFVLILLVIFCISGCAMFENSYSDKLYTAIVNDDYDEFKRLLQQGGDVNQMRSNLKWLSAIDYENLYPLEIACKRSPQMANDLLDAGAEVDVVDNYISTTPLICALGTNHEERFELAERIISLGANIDHVDENGKTAVCEAASILQSDSEKTREKGMEVLKHLLANCDLDEVLEKAERTPLDVAAEYNNIEAISYILDNHIMDVNSTKNGYTPLMKAVFGKNPEACRILLQYGADPNIETDQGQNAYDLAKEKGDEEVIRILEQN